MRRLAMRIVPGVPLGTASFTAFAQAWPAKPLRLMNTKAAGSATDIQSAATTLTSSVRRSGSGSAFDHGRSLSP